MKLNSKILSTILGLSLLIANANAALIQEIQPLTFGSIAVLANDDTYQYSITRQGGISKSDKIIIVSPGQRGLYRVSDLPPNSVVVVTAQILDNELDSTELNNERMDFVSLDSVGAYFTDQNGEAVVSVGGTISTKGGGSLVYGNLPLRGDYLIEIDF